MSISSVGYVSLLWISYLSLQSLFFTMIFKPISYNFLYALVFYPLTHGSKALFLWSLAFVFSMHFLRSS